MRVLFLPCVTSVPSHLIPLLALNRMVKDQRIETAFLVSRVSRDYLRQMGTEVLDIDHKDFRTEMQAIGEFSPDVIVDDMSLTTMFTTLLSKTPRVTIQRTGIFRGYRARNPKHVHSVVGISKAYTTRVGTGPFPD